jgi:hypothetical protein
MYLDAVRKPKVMCFKEGKCHVHFLLFVFISFCFPLISNIIACYFFILFFPSVC